MRSAWLVAAAILLMSVPPGSPQAGSSFSITDPRGDPAPKGECSVVCENGPDPSVDLVEATFRLNATHLHVTVTTAMGYRQDIPLSSPPAYHSYLRFTVDGHVWAIVARDQEPFRLVKDPVQTGGDLGEAFAIKGQDRSSALTLDWGATPNRYRGAIDLRVFARDEGPPVPMRVTGIWMDLYGHKGNPASYHDRLPNAGTQDAPFTFTPVLPHKVRTAQEGLWKLTALDPEGAAPSAALLKDTLHVAYVRTNGTPSGAAGLYHAEGTPEGWAFRRLGNLGPEAATATVMAASGSEIALLTFPQPGTMEVWRRNATWTHSVIPAPPGGWATPPAFVPSMAFGKGGLHVLAKPAAGEGLSLLRPHAWEANHTFPDAVDGRLAVDAKGHLHVAWHGPPSGGALPMIHYATAADGWTDQPLDVLAATRLAPRAPFSLALDPKGSPVLAWTAIDYTDGGGPQLWAARIANGTVAEATLLARPLSAAQPATFVAAAFDGAGNLRVLHGWGAATALSILKGDGTVWTGGFLPREQAGQAYNGTRLHMVFQAADGVVVAEHQLPLSKVFHVPEATHYVPSQPPEPEMRQALAANAAGARDAVSLAPGLALLALATLAARRRD